MVNNKQWLDTMHEIRDAILDGGSGDVSKVETMLSDKWNNTQTYNAGDYAINNDILWKALQTNTGVIPSEGSTWTQAKITSDILQLNSTLNDKIKIVNFSKSGVSLTANQASEIYTWTNGSAPSGYKLAGVIGFSVGANGVYFRGVKTYNNVPYLIAFSNATQSSSFDAIGLYIKE